MLHILWCITLLSCCGSGAFPPGPGRAFAAEERPFTLTPKKEIIFFSTAAITGAAGSYTVSRVHAPNPNTLVKGEVPGIDRVALRLHSREAKDLSNITAGACTALPFLVAASTINPGNRETYREALIDLVMFAESSLLNQGLTQTAKGVFHRSRPWAYDSSLSVQARTERNAALSFWSGHASTAFNGAVFAGYVFQEHHPGSKLIAPVWAVGLSTAAATAVLRVRAGQHFPTDVIAGAAAGSFTGWLVPFLHRNPEGRFRMLSSVDGVPEIGMVRSF